MANKLKNVFVIGLDDFNLEKLQSIKDASHYHFHKLLDIDEVRQDDDIPVANKLDKAIRKLDNFSESIDAIVGYWDFPVSTMLPILCKRYDLITPSLESVLKCEHKYWSRLEQQKVVPDLTPAFSRFDPFDPNALEKINLPYPFWIKPVKSFKSYLGFKINNEEAFREAVAIIQENIPRIAEPFNLLLENMDMPEEVGQYSGGDCIAESIIDGKQCTLEGYNFQGKTYIYGIVDSIREDNASSFSRYQYPSSLPQTVSNRMKETAIKTIDHLDYQNGAFNIEFFYDPDQDKIWLLEVNTRISKSHCPLFEKVEGASHHEVMVKVALGEKPKFPRHEGPFKIAAKFMVRSFEDAIVFNLPDKETIKQAETTFPGTAIHLLVESGMHLADLQDQDSYSFEIAEIYMGARDEKELIDNYNKCLDMLNFEFARINNNETYSFN